MMEAVDETEDFSGEHHALTGNSPSVTYGVTLLLVNLAFIVIQRFAN
jgi:hypothetical protein